MNKELNNKELENINGGVCATFDQPRADGGVPIRTITKKKKKPHCIIQIFQGLTQAAADSEDILIQKEICCRLQA